MVCRVESCWVAGPLIKVRQKPTNQRINPLKAKRSCFRFVKNVLTLLILVDHTGCEGKYGWKRMFKDHFLRAPWLQKWLEITRILYAKLQVGDITMWLSPVSVFSVQAYHQNLQSQGTLDFGAAIAFMPHSSMTSLHSAPKLNAYQFRGKTFCRVLIDGDFIIFNHYPLNLKNTYPLRSMSTFCWQYIFGAQIQDSKTDGASNVLRRRRSWLRARGISGSPWLVSGEPCLAEKICCSGSGLGLSHLSTSCRFWKLWPSCSFSIFWPIAASATDCHSAMGWHMFRLVASPQNAAVVVRP